MKFSIKQYAFIFSASTILLIALFAYRSHIQFEHTKQQIEQSHQQAAHQELKKNLSNATKQLFNNAQRLTTWEETHQQLDNPAYFAYWFKSRMSSTASEIDPNTIEVMIYNAKGKSLAKFTDISLPHTVEQSNQNRFLPIDNDSLVFTIPIQDVKNKTDIKGYLSVKTNMIKLLQQQTNYYYISPDSLVFSDEALGLEVNELAPKMIKYQLIANPELTQLENQVRNSIIQLVALVILPAIILYGLLVYIISVPINNISGYIQKLRGSTNHKDTYNKRSIFTVKELDKVYKSLHDYHAELFDTHAILDEKNKALWDQAHHDALTGVYNRRAFDDQWKNLTDLLSEHRVNISFILFDVNLFKTINDTHGHQVGDEVLKAIADCISSSLRKGEHLFRLGGDEFASFLIDSSADIATDVAKRCLENISAFPFDSIGMPEPVRVSIGISQATSDEVDSLKNLQWQADAAMYEAKRPGSPDIVVYSHEITRNSKGLLSSWLSNTVYQAIDKGIGLLLYYQPIIDFNHNNICYYEALIRIRANDELISPVNIFNVVEARRFEIELDRAVISKLLEDLEKGRLPVNTGVSINLSAPTLSNPEVTNWLEPLKQFTHKYKIVIEVTETALITDIQRVTQHLNQLRKMNYVIALDDFGSGYSSVKYLASMPVDVVKFDITLVHSLLNEKQHKMIVRLAEMINEAGHQLVAEGIEDIKMLELVTGAGFHYGQGYFFGRPEETPRPQQKVTDILAETHLVSSQLNTL